MPEVTLEDDLRGWWKKRKQDWDKQADSSLAKSLPGGQDLWDRMPEIDSKAVAETSPIFERHLGTKLDVRMIREGGYSGIEDFISDVVPKMRKKAKSASGSKTKEGAMVHEKAA